MRKVIIIRYETDPQPNPRAAEALVEFYKLGEATIHPTPFGMVSCLMTQATAEQIYQKLASADIRNHFSVIELDRYDVPVKTLTSAGGVVTISDNENPTLDHNFIDSRMTVEEIQEELDSLLDKVQQRGVAGLSKAEKSRLDHLSNR